MKNIVVFYPIFVVFILLGCAFHDPAAPVGHESRQIVDIIIDEKTDALILSIRGNTKLAHTENRQVDPKKVVLLFPATGLDGVKGRFVPPDNDIIRSIITTEHIENETIISTINVALKRASTYAVTAENDGLRITFPKKSLHREKIIPPSTPIEKKTEPPFAQPAKQSLPAATVLKTVTAQVLENGVTIKVNTDGAITTYKTFTLVNPDRFVFDLYNIKSPHRKEQKIAVRSRWINQIRYFGHPHKLRLVIEAPNNAGSKYSTVPSETGLIIHISAK